MANNIDWLIERFKKNSKKTAFIHEDRRIDYGQLVDVVANFSSVFSLNGLKAGEVVVLIGDYSPEVFCAILALARMGCTTIPLTRQSVVEESTILGISGYQWRIGFDYANEKFKVEPGPGVVENTLLDNFLKELAPGLILFSSGSTGNPKGILHNFSTVAEKFIKIRPPVVAIPFLMIDHFGGINTLLAITSCLGTVVTVGDRSVEKICSAISTYKVELLPATPSFLNLLILSQLYKKYDLSSLKRITYGTEVMPESTLKRIQELFPEVKLLQTYGLSEVGVLHSQSRSDGSTWVRVGGAGFQTKVVDDILWIKSSYAMVGYLNADSGFDEFGWFNTQDKVEVDGEYFRILGRVTDLINVGGQKVYPAEVESVILEMEDIQDVAIYGESHNLLGQIVVAKVLTLGGHSADELKKKIRLFCNGKLAPFKIPVKVIVSDMSLYSARHKKIR